MSRYNLFQTVHKGLRAVLYETSMLLQRTDFTIEAEGAKAAGRVMFALTLFDCFRQAEDAGVLAAIGVYEPGVADAFDQDHKAACRMGEKIESLLNDFRKAPLPEQTIMGSEMVAQFEAFALFTILHMAREEQVANKMLWRYFTDAALREMAWKMTSNIEWTFVTPYHKQTVECVNKEEAACWLREIKNMAPAMTFRSLLKTSGDDRSPNRWNLMQDVLATATFLAN